MLSLWFTRGKRRREARRRPDIEVGQDAVERIFSILGNVFIQGPRDVIRRPRQSEAGAGDRSGGCQRLGGCLGGGLLLVGEAERGDGERRPHGIHPGPRLLRAVLDVGVLPPHQLGLLLGRQPGHNNKPQLKPVLRVSVLTSGSESRCDAGPQDTRTCTEPQSAPDRTFVTSPDKEMMWTQLNDIGNDDCTTHHLDCPLNVDLAVEAEGSDLIDDHVDHDEGSRPTDSRGAVDYDRTGAVCK